jgi:hypothetical protein
MQLCTQARAMTAQSPRGPRETVGATDQRPRRATVVQVVQGVSPAFSALVSCDQISGTSRLRSTLTPISR